MSKVHDPEETAKQSVINVLARSGIVQAMAGVSIEDKKKLEADKRDYDRLKKWQREHPAPVEPTEDQKAEAAISGLQRIVKASVRQGDPDWTRKFQSIHDEAVSTRKTWLATAAELAKLPDGPKSLLAAAEPIGKALCKLLPGAFTDTAQAVDWAVNHLPMTEARQNCRTLEAMQGKLSHSKNDARKAFWAAAERGARLGYQDVHGDNLALARLIEDGM